MSRIGKHPVPIPPGVTVTTQGRKVDAKGRLGALSSELPQGVEVAVEGSMVKVTPVDQTRASRAMWGLARTLVANLVNGVSTGFSKKLEIAGVGYRAAVDGRILNLQLGYSHDIKYAIPEGIEVKCETPAAIAISGADRQRVGQIAAEIRSFRKPEPYKGKGIKYAGEVILRKEGKKK